MSVLTKQQTESLLTKHDPLALFIARRWMEKYGRFRDDLIQAARIGLWRAIVTYEPTYNTVLGTWAAYKIRHEIQEMLRKSVGVVLVPMKKCRVLSFESEPLNDIAGEDSSIDAADARCDAPIILKTFTKRQRFIATLRYAEGASSTEIAEITGLTRSYVNILLSNIRRKYVNHGISPCESCKWQSLCDMHNIKVCEIKEEHYLDAETTDV